MKKYLVVLFSLLWINTALANACAWVSGSSKNWSDSTAWTSCGSVAPTAADTVTVSGTGTLTINGTSGSPSLARSVDFTGFTGTLAQTGTATLNIGDASGGALTLVSGMTYSPASTSTINFVSTTGPNNINTGTKTLGNITFNGVGGSWVDQAAVTTNNTSTTTLSAGTLNLNNFNLGTGSFVSQGSAVRELDMGSGTVTVVDATAWDVGNMASNLTISSGTSTLSATGVSETLNLADHTYHSITTGSSTATDVLNGDFTTASLTDAFTNSFLAVVSFGGNPTITGTFTANATAFQSNRGVIKSTVRGTQRTITAAAVTTQYMDIEDIKGAGAASWDLHAITGLSGDCGNNTGITFTSPISVYWVPSAGTSTGSFSAVTRWASASSGTAGTGRPPLCQDTSVFDSHSIDAGSRLITQDMLRTGSTIWTGVTNTPQIISSINYEEVGNITFSSGMSTGFTDTITLGGRGNQTLDFQTKNPAANFILNSTAGTYSLSSAFSNSGTLATTSGTLALNGSNLTTTAMSVNGGTVSGTGAITGTTYTQTAGTITLGGTMTLTGAVAISGGTFNTNGYGVTGHTTLALSGTGIINLDAQINGSTGITLSGGTTNDSGQSGEYKGTTFSCTGGTHTTRKLTLSSTFAESSTCNLTLPTGGSGTWATSWTETGTSYTQTVNGRIVKSSGAYNVYGNSCTFGD